VSRFEPSRRPKHPKEPATTWPYFDELELDQLAEALGQKRSDTLKRRLI
jgi:hypothetical protein